MKTTFLLLVQVLFSSGVCAQTKLAGSVMDHNGQPLYLANVYLEDSYEGASTDEDGLFEFTSFQAGEKRLRISFTGCESFSQNVSLNGLPQFFDVQLKEALRSLNAVVISASSFMAGDGSRQTIFSALDIATTAGATADIAGALNTLPGTQKVGESGRLFVRGGDGHETRTFIDGMVVPDAYSASAPNAPSRGRFLPFLFKGMSFSTGGYSAEFGQGLSSALVLDSKDQAENTRTDIGILSVGADLGHTHVWDRGSAGAKIHYTNTRPYFRLIRQDIDWVKAPLSLEGQAAFRQRSGRNGLLKVYGNFSQSAFSLYTQNMSEASKDLYDLRNDFSHLNGSYKNTLNENWIIRGGISYTSQQSNIESTHASVEEENSIHAKTVFEGSLTERVELKTGAEVIDRAYLWHTNRNARLFFHETLASTFAEADIFVSKRFVSRGGVRFEYNGLENRLGIDPRFSFAYKVGSKGQVSLAYGKFRQSPKNEWRRVNHNLVAEKADHYVISFQRNNDNRTLRIETYYKRYEDLAKFGGGSSADMHSSGYGFAEGIEMFWRDNRSLKNIDYWISYSFLHTRRNYLHFPVEATPGFASAHNFSVVYKHFIRNINSQLGFTYAYASGRPYHDPNSDVFQGYKTPSYQDLSLNWSYLPAPSLIIYLSCTNVLGRDNIFGYEYSQGLNADGIYDYRAIRQPAKRFLFAGIFITLSKEKSINQLPNL